MGFALEPVALFAPLLPPVVLELGALLPVASVLALLPLLLVVVVVAVVVLVALLFVALVLAAAPPLPESVLDEVEFADDRPSCAKA